jgi:hypothetical protein
MDKSLNYTGVFIGEKPSKSKKGEPKRTRYALTNVYCRIWLLIAGGSRGDILQDLSAFATAHNGCLLLVPPANDFPRCLRSNYRESLTLSAWNLLKLRKDISRARSHFLALTLRRTESSNPRTLYTLIEAEVIPWSVMDAAYANRGHFAESVPVSPRLMLYNDEQQRKREGGLGSVMVMSIELPKGDNRPPREAFKQVRRLLQMFPSLH